MLRQVEGDIYDSPIPYLRWTRKLQVQFQGDYELRGIAFCWGKERLKKYWIKYVSM